MSDVKTLALFLLIERIIAAGFMVTVVWKQTKLMRIPIRAEARWFRRMLYILGLILLIVNFVPIIIDIATFLAPDLKKSTGHPTVLGEAYAISNATFSMLAGSTLWLIYRLAKNEKTQTDYTEQALRDEINRANDVVV